MELIIGIAGLAVGIVAIVVSVMIARRYRERKELSYEVTATPKLLSVDEEIRGRIEVTYEGHPVTDLSGASVTIRNTGNRGIAILQDTEYETPVTLDFGKGAEIIGSPRITKTEPSDLEVTVAMDKEKVVLELVLLNPGQSVSIFALLTNFKGRVRVTGHIQDAKIKYVGSDKGISLPPVITTVLLGGACGLVGFGYLLYVSKGGDVPMPLNIFTVVAGVAVLFGMGSVLLVAPALLVVFMQLSEEVVNWYARFVRESLRLRK